MRPEIAEPGAVTFLVQILGDFVSTPATVVKGEDQLYQSRLFCHLHINTILDAVPKNEAIPGQAVLEVGSDTPFLVLAGGAAFFLCVGGQDGHHQLAVCAQGVNVLLFEVNIDAQELQFPDGFQQRDRIAGKPGNGLGDDQIDLSGSAIVKKSLEVLTGILGAGQGLVGINATVLPAGMFLNEVAVIADLGRQ